MDGNDIKAHKPLVEVSLPPRKKPNPDNSQELLNTHALEHIAVVYHYQGRARDLVGT